MSGGIAYVADIVGKKLGKKRLSFFGLRPRHTATLGTIFVGIVISLFTIAFVLLLSAPIRQSLLDGSRIRKQLETDKITLSSLEFKVNERSTENRKLTDSNGVLSKTIDVKTKELAKRQFELTTAQTKLAELDRTIRSLQGRISALKAEKAKQVRALFESDKRLQTATLNLKRVQLDLKNNRANLRIIEADNNSIAKKNLVLVQEQDELIATQGSLKTELSRIQKEVSNLQTARETAQSDLLKSETALGEVKSLLAAEQSKLTVTQEQLREAENNYQAYKFMTGVSRNQPMIFRIGEEVVRSSVPAGLSVSAARGAVTNLVRRAQAEAHRRGAQKHSYPEAAIVEHSDPRTNETITPDMIEAALVKQIAGSPTRKVLIATSSLNAFRTESVSLEVTVSTDPLVYLSGQLVAETVIDGSRGENFVYDEFRKFLEETVKSHALKDGMIPVANSEVSFGQVSQTDLLQVIQQLRNANRTIRLEAHAVTDTYAADPLKLEFRLR